MSPTEGYQIALERIAACKQSRQKWLDLGRLNLQAVPPEINDLEWLEELNLGNFYKRMENGEWKFDLDFGKVGNQLTIIPPLKLLQLKTLWLESNQISEISGLEALSSLTSLNLDSNQISEISGLEALSSLTSLNLEGNQISKISGLEALRSLTSLDLESNQISKISGLEALRSLTSLNLESNQISKISDLEALRSLTSLNLSYNQISEISGLESLSSLASLNLERNQISEISGLESLRSLTSLNLSGNQISEISGLESLRSLTSLDLSGNQISEISGLESLRSLTSLYLLSNQISEISGLESLRSLTSLYLSDNQISEISGLESLRSLTSLDLRSNQISEISGLSGLDNLTSLNLNLSWNQITEVNPLQLPVQLQELSLQKQKITSTTIPEEILEGVGNYPKNNCLPDLRQWWAEIERESQPNRAFKLIFCGDGRVGKSSIIDALQGGYQKGKWSTHGISLSRWAPEREPDLEYFIWDLGGQEIYHGTHQWFMRSRAVYVIVWERQIEVDLESKDPYTGHLMTNRHLPYWLHSVMTSSRDSQAIIVENQIDKYTDAVPLPIAIPAKWSRRVTSLRVSAEKGTYIKDLEARIIAATQQLPAYQQPMPGSWLRLRQYLRKNLFFCPKEERQHLMSKADFRKLCLEQGTLEKSREALLRFLHRTGFVYYDKKLLGETIILDQQWALDAIYTVLDRESTFYKMIVDNQQGRFVKSFLFDQWRDYSSGQQEVFLQFMKSCRLIFQANTRDKDPDPVFYIPQLMSKSFSKDIARYWLKDRGIPELYLKVVYPFLHYSEVQAFLVSVGQQTAEHKMYKYGVWLTWEDSEALLTADTHKNDIMIRVQGKQQIYLLSAILNRLKEEFSRENTPTLLASINGQDYGEVTVLKENLKELQYYPYTKAVNRANLATADFQWLLQMEEKASLDELPKVVHQVSVKQEGPKPPMSFEEIKAVLLKGDYHKAAQELKKHIDCCEEEERQRYMNLFCSRYHSWTMKKIGGEITEEVYSAELKKWHGDFLLAINLWNH